MITLTIDMDVDVEFARIVDELTRRRLLGGLAGSAALLGLSACGASGAPRAPAPSARTIDTKYGPVTTPAKPTRVVCVDTYTVSALLDVGFTPIGVGDGGSDFILAKYQHAYTSIAKVASADDVVDLEAIAALNPDLILGVDYPYIASVRTKLAAIAPTAIFTWDSSGDWRAMAASAADAVGRAAQESTLEAQYRQQAAEIREHYSDVLASARIDLVSAGGGQAYVWLPGSGVAAVLADAGVRFGSASQGPGVKASAEDLASGFKALSYEQLDLLSDATAIITLAISDGAMDPDSAAMTRQAVFTRLPAAKAGNVAAFVNFFPFSYGQAIAALGELTALLDRIRKAA